MSRILAIDYGKKRVGFAITDSESKFCSPLSTLEIKLNDFMSIINYISNINKKLEMSISTIVVGYPLSLEGKPTETSHDVDKLIFLITKNLPNIKIFTHDERNSTKNTVSSLKSFGLKGSQIKKIIDKASAHQILQSFLDTHHGMN